MRKISVVVLCALVSASAYAQGQGRQGGRGTPPPPATETVAPAIAGVVAQGTKVTIVKDGLRSSEGPIAMPDGTTLFTEPGASVVHKIDKDGKLSVFLEDTNRANGLALDSKGRLLATTADSIAVLSPAKSVIAKMTSRPNDLVVDKQDRVWFTLPSDKPSAVYMVPAGGGQPMKMGEAPGAHGIQLSPDEKVLYSADSGGEYLVAFDVTADGKLTNKRNFGKYDGLNGAKESHADGIAVDSEGRVYVGIQPGVAVFDKTGKSLGLIPTSQRPQNLAFAGPNKQTLYIATPSCLFSLKTIAKGYTGRAK
jgi:gluconolactonase